MRILIIDDHAVVRQGLKQILTDALPRCVFGEAQNAQEAMSRLGHPAWDVAILDITMPGRGGLDVLQEIKRLRPRLPVLVLSMHPEDQYGMRVLKAGAAGYMNKECAPQELVGAINKIRSGGKYISPSLVERMAATLADAGPELAHERLSNREFAVFSLLASARTVSQIAAELSLSVKTVSTYRRRVLEKMGLSNNAELMRYAVEHRLVS